MPRGGRREGAGRPPIREWLADFKIGQDCEVLWREAEEKAWAARLAALPHAAEIRTLQDRANAIPVSARKGWIASDAREDHSGDLEAWLHARAGTKFIDETGSYESAAPRGICVSKKPPKGTRKQIVAAVAERHGISLATANRLWKAYRRFERDGREGLTEKHGFLGFFE